VRDLRQPPWHDRVDDVGERREVVTRRPPAELEQVGRQERRRVEEVEHGPHLAGRRRRVRESGDHAGARLPAERDAHTHAHLNAILHCGRHAIREEIVPRDGRKRRDLDEPVHP
jgi:hypothetical protein